MRECLRHSIRTPHGIRKLLQLLLHLLVYGSSAYKDILYRHQLAAFCLIAYRVVDLHRHHGSEIYLLIVGNISHRMSLWLDAYHLQIAHQASHHHHLAGNIVHRQTHQGFVASFQPQCLACHLCRGFHAHLLSHHQLRLARRSAGIHRHGGSTVVPLRQEIIYCHNTSSLLSTLSAFRYCR